MMRRLAALSIVVLALAWAPGPPANALVAPAPPDRIASIGDSITRAADVCCWYGDHPANSWSTGGAWWDGISSHYERLRAINPAIAGRNHNDAVSGAKMANGPAQAERAVTQQAQYVTVMLGANDVCTSSPGTMTSVANFRAQWRQTLATLMSGLPNTARVFVASIPDVYRLWEIYRTDWTARLVWDAADICQSLLAPTRTAEDRSRVRQRTIAFNAVLAQVCAVYVRCRFDGNAVFNFQFARSHVSKLDYFHPSLSGQAELARVTWARTWWN